MRVYVGPDIIREDAGWPTEDTLVARWTYPNPYKPQVMVTDTAVGYISTTPIDILKTPAGWWNLTASWDVDGFSKQVVVISDRLLIAE